jgi:hypothetical protein
MRRRCDWEEAENWNLTTSGPVRGRNECADLAAIPIDLDFRTEQILRKALLLADDWKVNSPDLVRLFMPE